MASSQVETFSQRGIQCFIDSVHVRLRVCGSVGCLWRMEKGSKKVNGARATCGYNSSFNGRDRKHKFEVKRNVAAENGSCMIILAIV